MIRLLSIFLIFFFLFMIQSCASTQKKSMMRNDPLIGKIIQTKTGRDTRFEALIKDISSYDVIYLSEKHDNAEHHAIQQKIIQALIKNGQTPAIGFEFFSMADTSDLLNFIDSGNVTHSEKTQHVIETDLRKKLGWDTQSDKMWSYYFDLLKTAKENKLPVAGIDLSSTLKRRITRKGVSGINALEKEQVISTGLSDPIYKDYMFSIFKSVHCGMGHGKMQSRLYDTWVARNDKMADSIVKLAEHFKAPAIIIIGGGHTEYGLGVIDRVSAIDSHITQVNIAVKEISIGPSDLEEYLLPLDLEGYGKVPPADYIWFTQRVSYTDPCEEFKKSLNKMKKSSKE